jgi:anti-anti-sigma regulatory factor
VTIVDGGIYEHAMEAPAAGDPAVRLEVGNGIVRVVLTGVLTAAVAAAARELLLEACELDATTVVLDLRVVLGPRDRDVLRHLVDVAQRRCWAVPRHLDVIAADPAVREALASTGIY